MTKKFAGLADEYITGFTETSSQFRDAVAHFAEWLDGRVDEPGAVRDERLGRVLYERMEHMDPSHESREWEQLTDRERELYATCAESVVVALNRAEPGGVTPSTPAAPVLPQREHYGSDDDFTNAMNEAMRKLAYKL